MRSRSILNRATGRTGVNVTPMIDVVMCLIVFYLMVGQLAVNRASGVRVPGTEQGEMRTGTRTDPIVIAVRPDGSMLLDGFPIVADRLEGELAGRIARDTESRVEVRADRSIPFGSVRPAIRAARDAGVGQVELVTEQQR